MSLRKFASVVLSASRRGKNCSNSDNIVSRGIRFKYNRNDCDEILRKKFCSVLLLNLYKSICLILPSTSSKLVCNLPHFKFDLPKAAWNQRRLFQENNLYSLTAFNQTKNALLPIHRNFSTFSPRNSSKKDSATHSDSERLSSSNPMLDLQDDVIVTFDSLDENIFKINFGDSGDNIFLVITNESGTDGPPFQVVALYDEEQMRKFSGVEGYSESLKKILNSEPTPEKMGVQGIGNLSSSLNFVFDQKPLLTTETPQMNIRFTKGEPSDDTEQFTKTPDECCGIEVAFSNLFGTSPNKHNISKEASRTSQGTYVLVSNLELNSEGTPVAGFSNIEESETQANSEEQIDKEVADKRSKDERKSNIMKKSRALKEQESNETDPDNMQQVAADREDDGVKEDLVEEALIGAGIKEKLMEVLEGLGSSLVYENPKLKEKKIKTEQEDKSAQNEPILSPTNAEKVEKEEPKLKKQKQQMQPQQENPTKLTKCSKEKVPVDVDSLDNLSKVEEDSWYLSLSPNAYKSGVFHKPADQRASEVEKLKILNQQSKSDEPEYVEAITPQRSYATTFVKSQPDITASEGFSSITNQSLSYNSAILDDPFVSFHYRNIGMSSDSQGRDRMNEPTYGRVSSVRAPRKKYDMKAQNGEGGSNSTSDNSTKKPEQKSSKTENEHYKLWSQSWKTGDEEPKPTTATKLNETFTKNKENLLNESEFHKKYTAQKLTGIPASPSVKNEKSKDNTKGLGGAKTPQEQIKQNNEPSSKVMTAEMKQELNQKELQRKEGTVEEVLTSHDSKDRKLTRSTDPVAQEASDTRKKTQELSSVKTEENVKAKEKLETVRACEAPMPKKDTHSQKLTSKLSSQESPTKQNLEQKVDQNEKPILLPEGDSSLRTQKDEASAKKPAQTAQKGPISAKVSPKVSLYDSTKLLNKSATHVKSSKRLETHNRNSKSESLIKNTGRTPMVKGSISKATAETNLKPGTVAKQKSQPQNANKSDGNAQNKPLDVQKMSKPSGPINKNVSLKPFADHKDSKQKIETPKCNENKPREMLSLKTFAEQAQKQQNQQTDKSGSKNPPLKDAGNELLNKVRNQKVDDNQNNKRGTKSSTETVQTVGKQNVNPTCKVDEKMADKNPPLNIGAHSKGQLLGNKIDQTQDNKNKEVPIKNSQNLQCSKEPNLKTEETFGTVRISQNSHDKNKLSQGQKPESKETVKPSIRLGTDIKASPLETKNENIQIQTENEEIKDKNLSVKNSGDQKIDEKITNPLQPVGTNIQNKHHNLSNSPTETYNTTVTFSSKPQGVQKQNQKAAEKGTTLMNPTQAFGADTRNQPSKANINQIQDKKIVEGIQNNKNVSLDASKLKSNTDQDMVSKNPLLALGTAVQNQASDPTDKQTSKTDEKINNKKTDDGMRSKNPMLKVGNALKSKISVFENNQASKKETEKKRVQAKEEQIRKADEKPRSQDLSHSKGLPLKTQKVTTQNVNTDKPLPVKEKTAPRKQQDQNKVFEVPRSESKPLKAAAQGIVAETTKPEQSNTLKPKTNECKLDSIKTHLPKSAEAIKTELPKPAQAIKAQLPKPTQAIKNELPKQTNEHKKESNAPKLSQPAQTNGPNKVTATVVGPKNSPTSRLMDLMKGNPITPEKNVNPVLESPQPAMKKVANSALKEIKDSLPGQNKNTNRPSIKIPVTPELRAARNMAQSNVAPTPVLTPTIPKPSPVAEVVTKPPVKQEEPQKPKEDTPKTTGSSTSQVDTSKGAIRTIKPINKRQSFHTAQKFLPNLAPENPMRKMIMNNKNKSSTDLTTLKFGGRKWYSTESDLLSGSTKKLTILYRRDAHSNSAQKEDDCEETSSTSRSSQAPIRNNDAEYNKPEPYTSPYPSTLPKESNKSAQNDRTSKGNSGAHFSSFKVQMPNSKIVNNFHFNANGRNSPYETTCNNPSFSRLNINTHDYDYKNNDEPLDEQYALNTRIPRESACVSYHRANSGQRVVRGGHIIKSQASIPVPLENFDEYVDEQRRKSIEAQQSHDKQKKPIIDSKNLLRELTSHLRPDSKAKKVVPLLTAADIKKQNELDKMVEQEEQEYAENSATCDGVSQKAQSKKLLSADSNGISQQAHNYSTMVRRSMSEISTEPVINAESEQSTDNTPETARKFTNLSLKQIVSTHRAALRKITEVQDKASSKQDDYTSSLLNINEPSSSTNTWNYSNLRKDMAKDMSLGIASNSVEYAKQAARNRSMRMHINKGLAQEEANAESEQIAAYVVPRRKLLKLTNKIKEKQMNPMLLNNPNRNSNQSLNIPKQYSGKTLSANQKQNSSSRFDSIYYKSSSSPE